MMNNFNHQNDFARQQQQQAQERMRKMQEDAIKRSQQQLQDQMKRSQESARKWQEDLMKKGAADAQKRAQEQAEQFQANLKKRNDSLFKNTTPSAFKANFPSGTETLNPIKANPHKQAVQSAPKKRVFTEKQLFPESAHEESGFFLFRWIRGLFSWLF